MKILKTLLTIIIGIVLIFMAIGLLKPSFSYGHEITVDKSVKEAWAVQQDESRFGEWLEGFKSIDLISGQKGAIGSKYKVVVNPGEGQEDFEMIETLVSKKDFDHVTINFDSDMMLFDQTTSFAEKDGKTTITTHSEVKGKGIMMRSIFALMHLVGDSFTKQEVKNIEALKKLINSNTINYYSTELAPAIEMGEEME